MDQSRLSKTELHVHTVGCYHPEDLLYMVRDSYRDVDWNRFGFLDRYESVFGVRPDPIAMFQRALATGSLDEIREVAVYRWHPGGRFEEFDTKSYFPVAAAGYHLDTDQHQPILAPIVEHHRAEGLTYVEYRNAFAARGQEFKDWHGRYARFLRDASDEEFTARYIIRLDGRHPVSSYMDVRELIDEKPDLSDTIVGVDFSGREIPPKNLAAFYHRIAEDNRLHPGSVVEPVVHIGESFFDLSLESAVRWCHESALYGGRRLAHCIALGIDPLVAVGRREGAHQGESAGERMDQIRYDLTHARGLSRCGVGIRERALEEELDRLAGEDPEHLITRPYDEDRLYQVSRRQDYVLDDLCRLGTVIETCPTSNLCIGGVPNVKAHPFPKLYASGVNLAICSDDPGIFGVTLAQEVANVSRWFGLSMEEMARRLGDPWEFRLASQQ